MFDVFNLTQICTNKDNTACLWICASTCMLASCSFSLMSCSSCCCVLMSACRMRVRSSSCSFSWCMTPNWGCWNLYRDCVCNPHPHRTLRTHTQIYKRSKHISLFYLSETVNVFQIRPLFPLSRMVTWLTTLLHDILKSYFKAILNATVSCNGQKL